MKSIHMTVTRASLALASSLAWTAAQQAPAWAQYDDEEAEEAEDIAAEDDSEDDSEDTEAESDGAVTGWFRVDVDSLGTQLWFGATHQLGGLSVASDIYMVDTFAELDVGLAFTFGNLALTPMVGVGFDFSTLDMTSLIAPQLFSVYSMGSLYFESWIQLLLNSPFTDGAQDVFYTRNFLLYELSDSFLVGPQIEISANMNESVEGAGDSGLASLPIGGRVNLGYGESNTLGIFLGLDTKYEGDAAGITGRFTFIRTW